MNTFLQIAIAVLPTQAIKKVRSKKLTKMDIEMRSHKNSIAISAFNLYSEEPEIFLRCSNDISIIF